MKNNIVKKAVKLGYRGLNLLTKHSPLIFTAAGIVGLGATAYFAYKAAPKVEHITDQLEKDRKAQEHAEQLEEQIRSNGFDSIERDDQVFIQDFRAQPVVVSRMKVVRDIAGAVALPAIVGIASATSIGIGYTILNHRLGAVAASLASATAENEYFRNKYKKENGEKKAAEFFAPTEEVEVEQTQKNGKKKQVRGSKPAAVRNLRGEWFDQSDEYVSDDNALNEAFIQRQEQTLIERQALKGYISLNEVRERLGFGPDQDGAAIGWTVGDYFCVNADHMDCVDPETGEVNDEIFVHWPRPRYIYDKINYHEFD